MSFEAVYYNFMGILMMSTALFCAEFLIYMFFKVVKMWFDEVRV